MSNTKTKRIIDVMDMIRVDSYTDHMWDVVEKARRNVDLLDGTIEPIKRLFEAGNIVIAVWDEPGKLSAASRVLKGNKLLAEAIRSGEEYRDDISVIPCQCFEQAVAIEQMFGAHDDDDAGETEKQPSQHHVLWPGVPEWSDLPPAPADGATTVTHWLSFADDGAFYGVVVVDGDVEVCVANMRRKTIGLGCHPGHGGISMQKLQLGLIPKRYKNRLLSKDEAERLLQERLKAPRKNQMFTGDTATRPTK
jgi:hypothetical protein